MKIRVGVFFGGRTVEHEVSIITGLQAMHALDKDKYEAFPVYVTKEGLLYTGSEMSDTDNFKDIKSLLSKSTQIFIINENGKKKIVKYPFSKFGKNVLGDIDVAFLALHGTNGEDGTFQGYFESLNLPYTGCDIMSSAAGMDKVISKKVLKESGVPVVDYRWFNSFEWNRNQDKVTKYVEELGYPVIVKPANTGSSVGIKSARNREELQEAVENASQYSNRILVETMIESLREINCSVIGDAEEANASVCEEPVSSKDILTYQDKYLNNGSKGMGGAKRKIPAELSEERTQEVRNLAVETFRALGCSGVARIDFLIDKNTDKLYVNEINTIPGSLAFYLWEPLGKNFEKLTDELVRLALKRDRQKNQLIFSYESNILSMGGIKGIKK